MINLKTNIPLFVLVYVIFTSITSCQSQKFYEQSVKLPPNATLEEKVAMAAHVVPSKKQLDWQKMEMTAFLHFGINTFTNREWGTGKEDPALFDPTHFNAEQWVRALKEAGMNMVILTAKHHDGFCLWPTKTTTHSVASSPWKNGNGDVVKAVKEACEKYNMKFGIYLSPWDRNAAVYGTKAYNDFFIAQLTELLTNYGKVDEVWFDGANGEGPNGKKQVYDWQRYYKVIHKLQPQAVVAVMGEDVRWVGTESGYGRETEWSVTALAPGGTEKSKRINEKLGLKATSEDLGSREIIAKADHLFWYPAEVDVSIRPGWFYHPGQDDQVKSLEKLVDIYFNSVGRNAVLLLNIPPDRRGLIHENDVKALMELRNYLDKMYAVNYAETEGGQFPALLDDDYSSYYALGDAKGNIILDFGEKRSFNVLELQEYIPKGQRIERFSLFAWKNNNWKKIAGSTTVGYKKLIRFDEVTTKKIKLAIEKARGDVYLNKLALYQAPGILADPKISRNKVGLVTIEAGAIGNEIFYTLNGTKPTINSKKYTAPFEWPQKGVIKAISFVEDNTKSSNIISKEFDVAKTNWQVIGSSAALPSFPATNAIDGLKETMWHSPWDKEKAEIRTHPHFIAVDLGEDLEIKGFQYTPRTGENKSGTILKYNFYTSDDGENWTLINSGKFSNIKNNPMNQKILFEEPVKARYFKFESLAGIYDEEWISMGEIGVVTP